MKKMIVFIIFILIFSMFLFLTLFNKNPSKPENKIFFKEHCFFVELAKTDEELKRGLMFKKELNPDSGMLFVFDKEKIYPFWMKNTLIPLDIIWLNEEKEIVFMSKNTPPCFENNCKSIVPDKESKYVLEISGGVSDKINLEIGDKLIFNIDEH
ncbi:MAG: DUF192 domain-containing protein [Candidatus Nealsonbacteria bacterium]|nr:DUF192 domain-containing protein [Candidatus Nealsonbacteria bacterium]